MPIRRHRRFIGLPESKYAPIALIEPAFMLFCQKNFSLKIRVHPKLYMNYL
jgi:hypothetical protein